MPATALSRAAARVVESGDDGMHLDEQVWARLEGLPDPRSPQGRIYPLPCLIVILSQRDDHGCDLGGRVEDGVIDAAADGFESSFGGVGSLSKGDGLARSGWRLVAARSGLALVAQGAGELVAELVAFVSQLSDLVVGGFQTAPQ